MGASITVRTVGQDRLERELGGLARAFGDLEPLMDAIGLTLESNTLQRFDDEEAPDGSDWLPSLRAKETGGKTLTDTARLKGSITYRHSASDVEVGTNVKYAGVHQGGATIRPKGDGKLTFRIPGLGFRSTSEVVIPARPFLGISATDEVDVLDAVETYAAGAAPGMAS